MSGPPSDSRWIVDPICSSSIPPDDGFTTLERVPGWWMYTLQRDCYIVPNNSGSAWVLPAGAIGGAALRVNMMAGSSASIQGSLFIGQVCCSTHGAEFGVANVSFANPNYGAVLHINCPCTHAMRRCDVDAIQVREQWNVGDISRIGSEYLLQSLDAPENQADYRCQSGLAYGNPSSCSGDCPTITVRFRFIFFYLRSYLLVL